MFIYERNGKLNVMVKGNKPATEGVTPDVTIEPVESGEDIIAKITVNGVEVAVVDESDEG